MNSDPKNKYFTKQLTTWHANENTRSLPWKNEQDPYKIWLSEVILQQTRALQGLPYYERFIEAYPTVKDLAGAQDEQAFRLWQGLGYYNRCKNMLATARHIANELSGEFPNTYETLLQLKGIGPYTASAIASFAFRLPHAVVDGNVFRVLSRYFGIETPFDTTEGKKVFSAIAQELLDTGDSAGYNQAIMDLGATVCTPGKPSCAECPLQKKCFATEQGLIDALPVRSKKIAVRKRYFHYLVLKWENTVWVHKRAENDIWANLHEFALVESTEPINAENIINNKFIIDNEIRSKSVTYDGSYSQRLTHQLIETRFFTLILSKKPHIGLPSSSWVDIGDLGKTAFPKTLVSFLENNLYF